ncbi:MAG: hypothetical protein CL536_05335 [Alcaligenaceae bacterium]|nr:hypothetical protein [Alcaligenaceae bacterium]
MAELGKASIYDFLEALRVKLPNISLARAESFLQAAQVLPGPRSESVYWAGRYTLCASREDLLAYDACFKDFFGDKTPKSEDVNRPDISQSVASETQGASLIEQPQETSDEWLIAQADAHEQLKNADIANLSDQQREDVFRLIVSIRARMPVRLTHRATKATRGLVDPLRTVRSALESAGELEILKYRKQKVVARRCIVLLDISRSMQGYTEALIRFGYSLVQSSPRSTEVFALGTRLTRLTHDLRHGDAQGSINKAISRIPDWEGGTQLGDGLRAFLEQWGRRGMLRGAILMIASDGWESGGTDLLEEQLAIARRLSHWMIWINPHKSSKGYEPTASGMQAALPYLDEFVAGASHSELVALGDVLARVPEKRALR